MNPDDHRRVAITGDGRDEARMQTQKYNGGLTREQFLFYEIRIAAKLYLEGKTVDEALMLVRRDNLFQYPTERMVPNITRTCYRRLDALGNGTLVEELAHAPAEIAKQINLYAMMRYNRLVREFMTTVIGEKFRNQDFAFSRRDVNAFFTRLQAQDDGVASWSEQTIDRIKRVLVKSLVEAGHLDSFKSETLNPVFLCEELENGIRANDDEEALPAFNCFR